MVIIHRYQDNIERYLNIKYSFRILYVFNSLNSCDYVLIRNKFERVEKPFVNEFGLSGFLFKSKQDCKTKIFEKTYYNSITRKN